MKNFTSLFFALFLCQYSIAQDCESDRYQERIFEEITVTSDIVYGQVDVYDILESDNLSDITLDFYEPVGEYLSKRPLVVMCFGGAFLFGEKDDSDMAAWCDSLAHRGYACASIDYRTGFNISSERSAIRAVYRAVQDLRAALRFLQEDPNDMGFNVDPDHIFVGGQSAGAITSIHTAFLKDEERPIETFVAPLPIFPGDNNDMGGFDESGNTYSQFISIKGIISMWGAVDELDYIDAQERIPMLMVHGSLDPIVPYGTGSPFSSPTFPEVHGSSLMAPRLDNLNIYNEFYPYPGDASHTVYGAPNLTFPNGTWNDIFENSQVFLHKLMCFDTPTPLGPTQVDAGEITSYCVLPEEGATYCWSVQGGQILGNNDGACVMVRWDENQEVAAINLIMKNCIDVVGKVSSLLIEKNALALELIAFEGQALVDEILLNWTSVADAQHQDFIIEKSKDGEIFHALSNIENKGLANTNQQYKFADTQPFQGTNYYRLKMVSRSGAVEYSQVIGIDFKTKDWGLQTIYVQDNQVFVDLETVENEALQTEIYNMQGQLLWFQRMFTVEGKNHLDLGQMNMAKGIYVLKIRSNHKEQSWKFVF